MILEIAYNIILPIFLVVGVSALVDRVFAPDPRALSRLVVYLFTPFLVLDGIAHSDLSGDEGWQLVVIAVWITVLVALAAWGLARLLKFDRKLTCAFVLSAVLINAGNYGVPLNEFAFGEAGRQRAIVYYVVTAVAANTLGVYIASAGTASTRQALINVLKVPLPYAAVLGLIINLSNITLDKPFERAITLLSQAAVPAMLVVLGVQLSRAKIRGRLRAVFLASGMRLVFAPLIAFLLVMLFDLTGVTRQVAVVQSGMSTAVMAGVLATEFDSDPDFVTAVILVSTLLSIGTLSVLLSVVM